MTITQHGVEIDGDKLMQFVLPAERYVREWLNAQAALCSVLDSPNIVDAAREEGTGFGCHEHGRTGYDLVTMFDGLHDMGDPGGAARHVRGTLKPDGTWMIAEPNAGDGVEENINPVGRAYYAFSTLLCTPASFSQSVGLALGAQAGQGRIGEVVGAGGFGHFRRAAETPFNLVFEARP